MILFISPNPHKAKTKEGFLQRVAAIDSVFKDHERVYFDDIEGAEEEARALADADLVYVHSIYSSKRILEVYPLIAEKIITDMHGVVPEEEKFAGNDDNFKIMSEVERTVFKFGKYFIAVSEAMVRHFREKYTLGSDVTWIVLPIFDTTVEADIPKKDFRSNVVYAGGVQAWQNVHMMVEAINSSQEYNFTILTHSPEAFEGISAAVRDKVTVKSVSSGDVTSYYQSASFGFLLRDDVAVNRVACPTKLIEYLCWGVVPIVKSANIGDAKELGLQYITLKDFTSKPFNRKAVAKKAKQNLEVLHRLRKQTVTGLEELRRLSKMVTRRRKSTSITPSVLYEYTSLNRKYEAQVHLLWKATKTISDQKYELEALRREIDEHKELLEQIMQSKSWQAVKKVRDLVRLRLKL